MQLYILVLIISILAFARADVVCEGLNYLFNITCCVNCSLTQGCTVCETGYVLYQESYAICVPCVSGCDSCKVTSVTTSGDSYEFETECTDILYIAKQNAPIIIICVIAIIAIIAVCACICSGNKTSNNYAMQQKQQQNLLQMQRMQQQQQQGYPQYQGPQCQPQGQDQQSQYSYPPQRQGQHARYPYPSQEQEQPSQYVL